MILVIALMLAACSGASQITIDENGLASWKPVKGAVQYEGHSDERRYSR